MQGNDCFTTNNSVTVNVYIMNMLHNVYNYVILLTVMESRVMVSRRFAVEWSSLDVCD